MQGQKTYKIDISAKTIIFTVFFLLMIFLVWEVKDLILSLFIAFIIMSAVRPVVDFLEKRHIPRKIAVLGIYLSLIGLCGFFIFWFAPLIVEETTLLIRHFPTMLENVSPSLTNYFNVDSLTQYVPNITNQAINIIKLIFSNLAFFITTIIFSVYFTFDESMIKKRIAGFLKEKDGLKAIGVIEKTEKKLGDWLLGEFFLMVTIGIMTYIGLILIGVRYVLPLAIIAGLLEIVPSIGPIISAVPALIVGLTQSPLLGAAIIALYFIVHQTENYFITPFIMKNIVGLNPIITLTAFIIGGRFFGVLGVLLAIPAVLFFEILIKEVFKPNK